jgi:hypothetical protein
MFSGGRVLCVDGFALFAEELPLLIKRGRVTPERPAVCGQLVDVSGMLGGVEGVAFQFLEFPLKLRVLSRQFFMFCVDTSRSFLRFLGQYPSMGLENLTDTLTGDD